MPDHYYTQTPSSAHDEREILVDVLGQALRFATDAGVFSKTELDFGSRLLLESLPPLTGRALDLGCGWGAIGVWMAAMWPAARVVMADINERAVHLAKENIRRNGLSAEAVQSDGLRSLSGSFDLIAINPPIRAGKAAIFSLYEQSVSALLPGGALYIVIQKKQGAESTLSFVSRLLFDVSPVAKSGGYWVIRGVRRNGV